METSILMAMLLTMWNRILGLIFRHGLTSTGGALVAEGIMTADQSNAIIGGVTALIGVLMSIFEKYKNKK